MLIELMRQAAAETSVRLVRVTLGSRTPRRRRRSSGFGFVEVGEQREDEDGLGLVFEVPV